MNMSMNHGQGLILNVTEKLNGSHFSDNIACLNMQWKILRFNCKPGNPSERQVVEEQEKQLSVMNLDFSTNFNH